MKLSRESWILLILGTADLVTTILWIERGMAQEANPLFHYFWQQGLPAFIAAKYVFLLGPILFLEWARWHRPRFALMALRTGALAYVVLYVGGVASINSAQAQPLEEASPSMLIEVSSKSASLQSGLPVGFIGRPFLGSLVHISMRTHR